MATAQRVIQLKPAQTLLLSWGPKFNHLHVYEGNRQIGSFNNFEELRLGKTFQLSDQQLVTVIAAQPHGLEVWYNGREMLSDSVGGEINFFNRAVQALLGIGVIQAVIGLLILRNQPLPDGETLTWAHLPVLRQLIESGFWLGLGTWGRFSNSKQPLYIGLVLSLLAFLMSLVWGAFWENVLLGVLAVYLYQAIKRPVKTSPVVRPLEENLID